MYNISIIGSLGNPGECKSSFTIDANYVTIYLHCNDKFTFGPNRTEPNRTEERIEERIEELRRVIDKSPMTLSSFRGY